MEVSAPDISPPLVFSIEVTGGVVVTTDGAFVYVANAGHDTVSVIDAATNSVVATVQVGKHPRGLAISP
jgi:YVTN family beta-propeller protein